MGAHWRNLPPIKTCELRWVGGSTSILWLDGGRIQLRATEADLVRICERLDQGLSPRPHGMLTLENAVLVEWAAQRWKRTAIRLGPTQFAPLRRKIADHIESVHAGRAMRYALNAIGLLEP